MTAEEIRQRGIDAVRALEGREVFPLIGELLEYREETGRRLAAICEAEGIGPYDDVLYGIGLEMIRRRERIAELEVENTRALAANERDRTGYARMVNSLYLHVQRWSGIASSRGPYEWDDEKYQEECGRCLAELRKIAERGGRHSHAFDTHDCPTTQAAVDAARATERAG